jgi:hypothetical protein
VAGLLFGQFGNGGLGQGAGDRDGAEAPLCCRNRPTVTDPAINVNTMKANPMLRRKPMSAVSFCAGCKSMVFLWSVLPC